MSQQFRPTSFKLLPPVIKNLLIINILLFIATLIFQSQLGLDLSDYLGLHYFTSDLFRPYQFVTYMFMHGGYSHILVNMFILWMFGYTVENYLGSKRFLILYMVTGIGAALIFLGFQAFKYEQVHSAIDALIANPDPGNYLTLMNNHFNTFMSIPEINSSVNSFANDWSSHLSEQSYLNIAVKDINQLLSLQINIPMVGASGAIFGVLMAFRMFFPDTLLYVYFVIPIKAKYVVFMYAAYEIYKVLEDNPTDNVAHFAHLGGMLFGFIMIKYWQKRSNRFY